MRILITGNMGYVGPVLVRHLRTVLPQAELIGYDAAFFADCLTTSEGLPETLLDAQYFGDVR
jgi:dTDP-D-glucose 4,6-dehydratase